MEKHEVKCKPFTVVRWTWTTFLGWLLGIFLLILFSAALDAIGIEHMQFYVCAGMGLGVGFAQWLTLRKYLNVSASWAWASCLGMGLPFMLFDLLLGDAGDIKFYMSVATGGTFAGSLQYRILKKQVENAGCWMPACFAGWTLSAITAMMVNYTMALRGQGIHNLLLALLNLLILLAGCFVLGIITGIAMKAILRQQHAKEGA